ncbi:MAG: MotA/TolQ/ExbB proton channel family protein [Gemmatimonadaceae bacterium]|nr:MotA/TolQ/ExbB proton channel family protein [Gemmatimonadaceae bacterium]
MSVIAFGPLWLLQLSTQGGDAVASRSIFGLILTSDPVTKAVLILLAVLSLLSWSIMFAKWRAFSTAEKNGASFVREFERARSIDEAMLLAQRTKPSAFTSVFSRAVQFLHDTKPAMGATSDRTARLSGSQVEALRLVLDSQSGKEREELGRFIPWLATVGSVSPLIGLFGTVLGVIEAFEGIATKGSGNIGAVAPGIATALIATAAALAVAIPAAFAYNVYAARLNRFDNQLEGFGSELIALMVREGRI